VSGRGPDAVVIGGGAIGLASAYYLAREGAQVVVLERGQLGYGASLGNAGLVVPSYCTPTATPARLTEGLRWIFRRDSPISMDFRANRDLLGWLLRFVAACTPGKVASTTRLLCDLAQRSLALFRDLPGIVEEGGFRQAGWLHLYRTDAGLASAIEEAAFLGRVGVRTVKLGPAEAREMEPRARPDLAGAIHYPDEADIVPHRFTAHLARLAREAGAELREHADVTEVEFRDGRVGGVRTGNVAVRAGHYVLAAGSWSPRFARRLGLRIPVQGARGYSLDIAAGELLLQRPLLLGEAHVIARPLDDRARITGGFELAHPDSAGSGSMPRSILDAPAQYLTGLGRLTGQGVWQGFRPATPDSIPLIGPTRRFPNLLLATGHGTLGMTLSLVTGRLIADLAAGRPLLPELTPVLPGRVGL
jgi:D-amino-acid dehydrogenase